MLCLLKLDQTAELLGVSVKHVRRLITAGELPHVRVGRAIRVDREKLEAWVQAGGSRPAAGVATME